MSTNRFLVLTIGPLALVAGCYWVAFGLPETSGAAVAGVGVRRNPAAGVRRNPAVDVRRNPAVDVRRNPAVDVRRNPAVEQLRQTENPQSADLAASCRRTAEDWKLRLGDACNVIVQPPLVIAGGVSESDLRRMYRTTIQPIYRAVSRSYLSTLPNQPITILMLDDVGEYRRLARKLDGYDVRRYHGYYHREDNRIVLDISSGNGTLAHELTHALVKFDFPAAPEWFDEGLASLHEQCEFSADGDSLVGLHNWRLGILGRAARNRRLQPLEKLIRHGAFRGEGEGLHYAEVRYLCLYLQQRGLLKEFYREFRDSVATDPRGIHVLRRILQVDSVAQIDEDFRAWLRKEFYEASRAHR